jgi:hypothetical protein
MLQIELHIGMSGLMREDGDLLSVVGQTSETKD